MEQCTPDVRHRSNSQGECRPIVGQPRPGLGEAWVRGPRIFGSSFRHGRSGRQRGDSRAQRPADEEADEEGPRAMRQREGLFQAHGSLRVPPVLMASKR